MVLDDNTRVDMVRRIRLENIVLDENEDGLIPGAVLGGLHCRQSQLAQCVGFEAPSHGVVQLGCCRKQHLLR